MTRLAPPAPCRDSRTGWDRLASIVTEPLAPLLRRPAAQRPPLRPIVRHVGDCHLLCEPEHAGESPASMRVTATGDLSDAARVKALYRMCNRLFDARIARVVVDLSGAEALDTKAVGCLLVLHRRAMLERVDLRVRCSETMHRWLSVCRVGSIIETMG